MKHHITKLFGKMNGDEIKQIPIDQLIASPYQPRNLFDDERLDELCQTIETHGVIQPIVVRTAGAKYEIIAGERRWRAVCRLGWNEIPAIVREFEDEQAASIALIENLQRENLTAIEEAVAFQNLLALHHITQENLAEQLGKSQSTIANKLRLLQTSEPVQQALLARKITERHARALLKIEDPHLQEKILHEIIQKEWNVKQTEQRILSLIETKKRKRKKPISYTKDVRVALNTIRQSIEMVAVSGMSIKSDEKDLDDHYEILIRIPKKVK